jgi:hypothetical protein
MTSWPFVIPDGVRLIASRGPLTIMLYEVPPQAHRLKWIARDSPVPYGGGSLAKYEERCLALPFVLIVAVFVAHGAHLALTTMNEAYFRAAPLTGPDDELCFPALLNVSRYPEEVADRMPLAWICTQFMDPRPLASEKDVSRRLRASLRMLRATLLETGFNYSSEHHELCSYWTLSKEKIDAVADVERWEALSREDPLLGLKIDWLPAVWQEQRLTVGGLLERIFANNVRRAPRVTSAADLARLVHNAASASSRSRSKRQGS